MNVRFNDSDPKLKRGHPHPDGIHLFWTYRWAGRTRDKGKKQMWVDKLEFDRLTIKSNDDSRRHFKLNPERVRKACRKYRENNLDEMRAKDLRKYYHSMKDPVKRQKLQARWRAKDRSERLQPDFNLNRREYCRTYKRNREQVDVNFKIKGRLRSAIYSAVKGRRRSRGLIDLLGCSVEFLKSYLEQRFSHGMSWDNYGRRGWHIDHVLPCAAFDLRKLSHQKKCFHYTNLQPLWAVENELKCDKVMVQSELAI